MELLTAAYAIQPNILLNTTTSSNSSEVPVSLSDELFKGYSAGLLTFASATCIIFILLGVPGNLITIIALARCKKVRNATAVFIINLSLSDLLFCCFNLPLAASTFWNRAWTHGELLCRLFPLLRYGLLAVSLFTVLAITINRYVMIGHPRIYPRVYRRKYLGIMVAATWLCAFGTLIPTWRGVWGAFGLDKSIGSCSILPDNNGHSPKEFLFIMAFLVPCLSIVICYARIFYIVRKTAMRSHEPPVTSNSMGSIRIQPNKRQTSHENVVNDTEKQLLTIDGDNVEQPSNDNYPNGNGPRNNSIHSAIKLHGYDTKFKDTELKFIDSSIDSDGHPVTVLLKVNDNNTNLKGLTNSDRNLSSVSINDTIEYLGETTNDERKPDRYRYQNGDKLRSSMRKKIRSTATIEPDSAVEESTSSSDNNPVYHIASESTCNHLLSVTVEPSSSSGIDLPLDQDSPPRKPKNLFSSSMKRFRRSGKNTYNNSLRKHSTINTSGASILYPGRMTSKDRRLLKMILVIFVSFLTCYLPITISKIIRSSHEIQFFHIMGYLLIYLTTCINPIIYVVMSSEYRQAYWNLLMCRTVARPKQEIVCKGSNKT